MAQNQTVITTLVTRSYTDGSCFSEVVGVVSFNRILLSSEIAISRGPREWEALDWADDAQDGTVHGESKTAGTSWNNNRYSVG